MGRALHAPGRKAHQCRRGHCTLPEEKLINAGEAFEDQLILYENALTHSHGPSGEHTHAGIDPHTWLDPKIAMAQCRRIAEALKKAAPSHEADFEQNLEALLERLEGLDQAFENLSKGYQGQVLMASHPAYNYLARRYGWKVRSFSFDPEILPEPDALLAFKAYMAEGPNCRIMLWESQPAPEVKEFFSENFQVNALVCAPVETPPEAGDDFITVMEKNIENITPAFH
jgi:zinc transport system substrate-binding protein